MPHSQTVRTYITAGRLTKTILTKAFLFPGACEGPHTQAAGARENQINPTVMVDAGNWHVFHTCQAAWRALTRPIKVYRRAAGPSITMTDRSGPSPSAGARAAEGRGRSGIGEPRGAGLKREDS